MFRLVLIGLLISAFVNICIACPPAQQRITIVDGQTVVDWFCPPDTVMYMHENIYRCFPTCSYCENGFCFKGECNCFPNTKKELGVCGKICPNCVNGWCSSTTKCVCNSGFININGKCIRLELDSDLSLQLNAPQEPRHPVASNSSAIQINVVACLLGFLLTLSMM